MMEDVPRTVLKLVSLATSSLFATIVAVGVAHASNVGQGSALCRACMGYQVAKVAQPGHPAHMVKAEVASRPS